jgi:hypothetical protein
MDGGKSFYKHCSRYDNEKIYPTVIHIGTNSGVVV